MRHFILFITATVVLLHAQSPKELRKLAMDKGLTPIPAEFGELRRQVETPKDTMTPQKVALGKKLFFDRDLSKKRDIACATCHDIRKGGEDGLPTAIGHDDLPNPQHLNTPTVLNTGYSRHLFWDARSPSLEHQAKGPTQAPFEMAATPELIETRVKENPAYRPMFDKAFGADAEITFDTITRAIAVYERTLVTRSAFDRFLEGDDDALDARALRGLQLFIDLGCKGCHFGPAVGGQKIQKFPLRDYNSIIDLTSVYDETAKKRHITGFSLNFKPYHPYPFKNTGGFLGIEGSRKFRVPILRNVTQTAPYFHNGVVPKLRDAVFLMGRYQLGLDLDAGQLDAVEAFLKSLEGELVVYPELE